MKRLIIILSVVFIGAIVMSSCEEDDCKMCREVTYNSDGTVFEDNNTPEEYCETELDEIEDQEPVTIGDLTTRWVCE